MTVRLPNSVTIIHNGLQIRVTYTSLLSFLPVWQDYPNQDMKLTDEIYDMKFIQMKIKQYVID